jgi:hypothetical protein
MDEVWELNGIIEEEDWSVIAHHIVVTLLSVELNSESSGISDTVVRTTLSNYC